MPYKHIAARLHKTELACRLHYHQMAYGSNRPRRTTSVANTTDVSQALLLMKQSPTSNSNTPPTTATSSRSSEGSPECRLSRYNLTPPSAYDKTNVLPLPRSHNHDSVLSTSLALNQDLRIDTKFTISSEPRLYKSRAPDRDKVRQLYGRHRQHLWQGIAREYSPDMRFTADELEASFLAGHHGPNTPEDSPPQTPPLSPRCLPEPVIGATGLGLLEPISFSATERIPAICIDMYPQTPFDKCTVGAILNS